MVDHPMQASEILAQLDSLPPESWTYHHYEQDPDFFQNLGIESSSNVLLETQFGPENRLKAVLYDEQYGAWWNLDIEQRIAIYDGNSPKPLFEFGAESLDHTGRTALDGLYNRLFLSKQVRVVPIPQCEDPEYLKKEYNLLVRGDESIDGLVGLVLRTDTWTSRKAISGESGGYTDLEGKQIRYWDQVVVYQASVGPFELKVSERSLDAVAWKKGGHKGVILGSFWAGNKDPSYAPKIKQAYLHGKSILEGIKA